MPSKDTDPYEWMAKMVMDGLLFPDGLNKVQKILEAYAEAIRSEMLSEIASLSWEETMSLDHKDQGGPPQHTVEYGAGEVFLSINGSGTYMSEKKYKDWLQSYGAKHQRRLVGQWQEVPS